MTAQKWNQGDVFTIPIDEARIGLGQIVDVLSSELYVVIYEDAWGLQNPPPSEVVLGRTPLMASLTLDAKLYHGHWKVIGNNTENLSDIKLPLSKVGISGEMHVENHDGSRVRPATNHEAESLRFRKTVAPVRLEKALQAYHGVIENKSAYDELRYDLIVDSKTM